LKELAQDHPSARVRRPGAGRKPAIVKDPTLVADLEALVEPTARGSGSGNANCRNWPMNSASTLWSATCHPAPAVEQNRAPSLFLHQPELASTASGQLSSDCRVDLGQHDQTGLTVRCELDTGRYPSGVVVSDAEMATLNIKRAVFHGEWNYTISPDTYPPNCAFIS
jgi:hypothetical protein